MHLCTFQVRATHICIDCGFIYTLQWTGKNTASGCILSFCKLLHVLITFLHTLQPDTYACPQCRAPKKRFARYDVNTGKAIGGGLPPVSVIIGLVAGIAGVGALLVYGLQWFTRIELQCWILQNTCFFSLVCSTAHLEIECNIAFWEGHDLINSDDLVCLFRTFISCSWSH